MDLILQLSSPLLIDTSTYCIISSGADTVTDVFFAWVYMTFIACDVFIFRMSFAETDLDTIFAFGLLCTLLTMRVHELEAIGDIPTAIAINVIDKFRSIIVLIFDCCFAFVYLDDARMKKVTLMVNYFSE